MSPQERFESTQQIRIAWRSYDGRDIGHGDWKDGDKEPLLRAAVAILNKAFCDTQHWIEYRDPPGHWDQCVWRPDTMTNA